jgi:hypothetical protein
MDTAEGLGVLYVSFALRALKFLKMQKRICQSGRFLRLIFSGLSVGLGCDVIMHTND